MQHHPFVTHQTGFQFTLAFLKDQIRRNPDPLIISLLSHSVLHISGVTADTLPEQADVDE